MEQVCIYRDPQIRRHTAYILIGFQVCVELLSRLWTHLAAIEGYLLSRTSDHVRVMDKNNFHETFDGITKEYVGKGKGKQFVVADEEVDTAEDKPPGKEDLPLNALLIGFGWKKIRAEYLHTAEALRRDGTCKGRLGYMIAETPWRVENIEKNILRTIVPVVGASAGELAFVKAYRLDLLEETPAGHLRDLLAEVLSGYTTKHFVMVEGTMKMSTAFEWSDGILPRRTLCDTLTVVAGYEELVRRRFLSDTVDQVQKLVHQIETSSVALLDKQGLVASEVANAVDSLINVSQLLHFTTNG